MEDAPWYELVDAFHFPHVAAVDLNETVPLQGIRNIDADYVLVEFYAPWCPHCQHFAMDYERVAQSFKNLGGSQKVVATTVDCMQFEKTCNKMGVPGFPTMMWASKAEWLAEKPKATTVEIDRHEAEAVTKWVGQQIKRRIQTASLAEVAGMYKESLKQARTEAKLAEGVDAEGAAAPVPADKAETWDMQLAIGLLLRSAVQDAKKSPQKKQVLSDFVQMLRTRFQRHEHDEECKKSLGALHSMLNDRSPGYIIPAADKLEKEWQLCGTPWKEYGQRSWQACRGTVPGKRGYTCGLWTLMHSLAARSTDETASVDLQVMRDTIGSFFRCKDCRDHFMKIPVNHGDGQSRLRVQRWWWRAHNLVNERVKGIEAKHGDGDAAFPKVQWPPAELCQTCRSEHSTAIDDHGGFLSVNGKPGEEAWDNGKVLTFIDGFYGP